MTIDSLRLERIYNVNLWRRCCKMFKLDPQKPTCEANFRFPGLTVTLNRYQLFAVYWFHMSAKDTINGRLSTNGGLWADAMGLGLATKCGPSGSPHIDVEATESDSRDPVPYWTCKPP